MTRYGSVLAAVLLVAVAFVIGAEAQKCRDFDEDTCEEQAAHGYCMYRDIQKKCPESCGLCKHSKKPGQSRCEDFDEDTCEEHAENGNCKYWEVQKSCPDSCDLCPDEKTSSTTATKSPSPSPSPSPIDTPYPMPSLSPSCFSYPTEICIAVDTSSQLKPKRRFAKDTVKAIEKTFGVFGTRFAGVSFGEKVYNSTPRFEGGDTIIKYLEDLKPAKNNEEDEEDDDDDDDDVDDENEKEGGASRIDEALKQCSALMRRPFVDRVVILIADKHTTDDSESPVPLSVLQTAADELKDMSASIFVLQTGRGPEQDELRSLSGKRDSTDDLYARIEEFNTKKSFRELAKKLVRCTLFSGWF